MVARQTKRRRPPGPPVTVLESGPSYILKRSLALLVPLAVLLFVTRSHWLPVPSFEGKDIAEVAGALSSPFTATKRAAARELSRRKEEAVPAIPEMARALHDSDEVVPRLVAEALRSFGSRAETAVPDLLAALDHRDYSVNRAAALTLVVVLRERALPPLMTKFEESPPRAKAAIAQALARLGIEGRPAESLLINSLSSGDPTVRRMSAAALGKMRSASAVPHLLPLLNDTAPFVAENAIAALGDIGPAAAPAVPALLRLLRENWQLESAAGEALAGIGKGTEGITGDLIQLLTAERESQQYLAAYALRMIDTSRSKTAVDGYAQRMVPKYISVLQRTSNDAVKRLFAAKALGYVGDERGFAPLVAGLTDQAPEVRQECALALGFYGDARAVAPLVAALKHDRSSGNAASALLRLGTAEAVAAVWEHEISAGD